MVHHGQLYQLSWIEDHFKLHPQKGTISKGKCIIFQPSMDIRRFVSFRGSNYEFLQAKHCDSSSPDCTRKTSWPISLPANKVCNVSDFLKSEHHFVFGGVLKNDHSTTVLHNWSIKDLKRRQSVTSSSHLFAQLIVDRGKPLQLYLQKPAFCHALKTSVIVHY